VPPLRSFRPESGYTETRRLERNEWTDISTVSVGNGSGTLDAKLCQVGGLNQNYTSAAGTSYHIQIEDRGPLTDRLSEELIRRVNIVVYANYGEATARIVYSRDHDYPDLRTAEHNAHIQREIKTLAGLAKEIIEEREQAQLRYIKRLLRAYHRTKDARHKAELDAQNALFPFLVSRAWAQIKEEKEKDSGGVRALENQPAARVYPLDAELRSTVMEIERMIQEVGRDLHRLKKEGSADDILLQTYRKLVSRAEESLDGRLPSQFNVRRLELTRQSLMTTWRQVRSRLKQQ